MNNTRRKAISKVIMEIEHQLSVLEDLKDEEQEYFDNIPENLQGSDRASDSEEAIQIMEEVIENVQDAVDNLGGL